MAMQLVRCLIVYLFLEVKINKCMDYTKLYYDIVRDARLCAYNGYTELHHIIPRSIGGTDTKDNLVNLSARQHFICHYLLVKMYKKHSFEWYKMNHAFLMMKASNKTHARYFNSRLYESQRVNFSEVMSVAQSGEGNSQYGKRWVHNSQLRKSKKISKTDPLPEKWLEGRVINFDDIEKEKTTKQQRKELRKKVKQERVEFLRTVMHYYRDNEITMRELCKKFNVNGNIYMWFEKHFGEEYTKIVENKPRNSNVAKGKYKLPT